MGDDEYQDEYQEPENGEINPADHEDYDDYMKAIIDDRIKKATASFQRQAVDPVQLAGAVGQAVSQAVQPRLSFNEAVDDMITMQAPDDEHASRRKQLMDEVKELSRKRKKAEIKGDLNPRSPSSVSAYDSRIEDAMDELLGTRPMSRLVR